MGLAPLLAKSRPLIRPPNFKSISTFVHLHRESQLVEPPSPQAIPPPSPATGNPLYKENLRSPISSASPPISVAQLPFSFGFLRLNSTLEMQSLAQTLDAKSLMDRVADWMTSQRWAEVKELFEFWIRCLDNSGKPNKPDLILYNHYLRANLMLGTSAGELLNLVAQMDDYGISPNTASFNLALKAMQQAGEAFAAEKLIERSDFLGKYL